MSVTSSDQKLSFDIKDFIELLQKNQNSQNRRKPSNDSGKLSIILSASEPESSLGDKENQQASANKSVLFSYSSDQAECILRDMKKISTNSDLSAMCEKLEAIFHDMKKTILSQESRLKTLENQYEEEKKGTDQVLKALVKMDESQKEIWHNYNELLDRHLIAEQKNKELEEENERLREDLCDKWKQMEFMRKLVLVANENYQTLERRCRQLEQDNRMNLRFRQQRSSPEISSRSARGKKRSSVSPSISERSNLSARKSEFQENYRRLVLRTLKSKAIR